jgi:hypothetical protein
MSDAWGGSWGSAWGDSWGSTTPVVVTVDTHDGADKRNDAYRKKKERLTEAINLAYNKVFGIEIVETEAAVEQVLEDVERIKLEAFDYEGMLADIKTIEDRGRELLRKVSELQSIEDDDEDILLLI